MKKPIMTGVLTGLALVSAAAIILNWQSDKEALEQTIQIPVEEPAYEPIDIPPTRLKLPFGGREVLPAYRFVALYGSPEYSGLGALGEQPLEEAIERTQEVAARYQEFSDETVIPTFEIITTVAAAELTSNNDYSREIDSAKLRPWIDAAKENNIYVILDLQPGRSTFLTQAKLYKDLLLEPHVGLALDPEWRLLTEKDRHLVKVGSVSAAEINETSAWLADLVKDNDLPQKLFMIHQFKLSMITKRETLQTNREELAYMIHMDGYGTLDSKTSTWSLIKEDLSENIYLGWKNFYDEDKPTPTPKQTMQQTPKPWFVSYQ